MANLIFKDDPHDWHCSSDYPKVPLTRISLDTAPNQAVAYVFSGHVNIDYDGSPTAYAPPEHKHPLPDDDLGNAWDDVNGWFGVFALPAGHALVQQRLAHLDQRPSLLHHGKYPMKQQAKFRDVLKDGASGRSQSRLLRLDLLEPQRPGPSSGQLRRRIARLIWRALHAARGTWLQLRRLWPRAAARRRLPERLLLSRWRRRR